MARSIQSAIAGGGRLAALRAKTDRDLARIVQRAVEAGLWSARESAVEEAEAIYRRVAQLLPLLEHSRAPEAGSVRRQAAELRSELDQTVLAGAGLPT